MTLKVFVDGQAGTTGLRLHDYLTSHDDVTLLELDETQRKNAFERRRMLNTADVAFLCLPDAASREAAAMTDMGTCLIDASTSFRTHDDWVYGLPELSTSQRDRLRMTQRIAVPGCHASAFVLLTRPLRDAELLPDDYPLAATSLTGYSGGGRQMIADYEGAPRDPFLDSPRPYALGLTHKHLPEMRCHGRLHRAPNFMPIVGPFFKGLTLSIPLDLGALAGVSRRALHEALSARYAAEAFVRVMPLEEGQALEGDRFNVQGCNGTNRVDLFVMGNDEHAVLMARLDNLGKGAAGAAVQCMNVRFGLPEDKGLSLPV